MTAPASMWSAAGSSGTTRETYFSPNRVLGTIEPVTFAGIVSTSLGYEAQRQLRRRRTSVSKSSTSPTMTPRILTSARLGSWSPIVEVCSVTSS